MNAVLRRLLEHPLLGPKIVHHRRVEGRAAQFAALKTPLPQELVEALAATGIERLFTHQAEALDAVADGDNVLVATPTASGKSLVFAAPALSEIGRAHV